MPWASFLLLPFSLLVKENEVAERRNLSKEDKNNDWMSTANCKLKLFLTIFSTAEKTNLAEGRNLSKKINN